MWALRALVLLLIALVALTPPVAAATAEDWTEGLYAAESDDLALAALDDAIEAAPPPVILVLQRVVIGVVPIVEERGGSPAVVGALQTRAPPRS